MLLVICRLGDWKSCFYTAVCVGDKMLLSSDKGRNLQQSRFSWNYLLRAYTAFSATRCIDRAIYSEIVRYSVTWVSCSYPEGAALLVGRSRDRFPVASLGNFSVVSPTESCALRSTQPLKVSARDFSWGKGGRCFWLTTYYPCSAETLRKSRTLTYPEPLGPPRPVAGHL